MIFSRFFQCIQHSQRSLHFQKLRAFSIRIFFHFILSLCAQGHYKKSLQAKIRRFLNNSPLLRGGLYGKKNALSPFPSSPAPLLLLFFLLEYPAGTSAEDRGTTFSFHENCHFAKCLTKSFIILLLNEVMLM